MILSKEIHVNTLQTSKVFIVPFYKIPWFTSRLMKLYICTHKDYILEQGHTLQLFNSANEKFIYFPEQAVPLFKNNKYIQIMYLHIQFYKGHHNCVRVLIMSNFYWILILKCCNQNFEYF